MTTIDNFHAGMLMTFLFIIIFAIAGGYSFYCVNNSPYGPMYYFWPGVACIGAVILISGLGWYELNRKYPMKIED